MRFYYGLLILALTGIFIEHSLTTELSILFGILAVISGIIGFLLTQFSKIGMRFDGLLLLILQLVFTLVVFLTTDIILGCKVLNQIV